MPNQTIHSIVFRADGNSQIGLGHIMRCLAIAEMIGKPDKLSFAIQQPTSQVLLLLQQASFQIISLPKETDYQIDAANFVSYLNGSEIVVLDGYSFEVDYQKIVKQNSWKLLAIDDLVAWHQFADIVINHGGNVRSTDYQAEPYTTFLLGTRYALLRSPFLEAARKRSRRNLLSFEPKHVFINLGGADPDNISLRVVETLVTLSTIEQIVVVLGAANPHGGSFGQYIDQGVQVCYSLMPEQMVTAIRQCDLAIVSCSTISYEVATIGRPFIGILTANNQLALSDFYTNNHIALRILDKDFTADDLASVFALTSTVVNNSLTSQQRFFDGKSGVRIARMFQTLRSTK